jgi:hypothetical protein
MIPTAADIFSGSGSCWWWWTGNLVIFLMSILSMVTPVISLLKPGFSYKGHPGMVNYVF